MDVERIFAGLNPEQNRAVGALRGPVCILAGAGSGKTTTITHRIANQVTSGAFRAQEILAVTFTDKAAGELRSRLAAAYIRNDGEIKRGHAGKIQAIILNLARCARRREIPLLPYDLPI